jgi:hypothetical protein
MFLHAFRLEACYKELNAGSGAWRYISEKQRPASTLALVRRRKCLLPERLEALKAQLLREKLRWQPDRLTSGLRY